MPLIPTGATFYGGTGDAWQGDPPDIHGITWKPTGGGNWSAFTHVPAPAPAAPAAEKPAARAPVFSPAQSPYQPVAAGDFPDLFQPDLYPRSDAYSGLASKPRRQIEKNIIPELVARAKGLPETIDRYTANAARLYERQSRQIIEGSLPGLLAQLGRRGMLNSSVAADAISQLGTQIVPTYANRAYSAGMTAARMQADVPQVLAAIANLARYSKSHSENPLAPYQLLSNFVVGY